MQRFVFPASLLLFTVFLCLTLVMLGCEGATSLLTTTTDSASTTSGTQPNTQNLAPDTTSDATAPGGDLLQPEDDISRDVSPGESEKNGTDNRRLPIRTPDERPRDEEQPDDAHDLSLPALRSRIIGKLPALRCENAADCRPQGLGNKPCGGFEEYVLLGNGDSAALETLIATYNRRIKEQQSENGGLVSNCMVLTPPTPRCRENICAQDVEARGDEGDNDGETDNLDTLLSKINDAARKDCQDVSDCRSLGIGARPCGGPSSYVAYSLPATNEAVLENLAKRYKTLVDASLRESGAMGTCDITPEPKLRCKAQKCLHEE